MLKSAREVAEFEVFAQALSQWIKITQIFSQPKDWTDITANFGEEIIGFELLSIVDEDLAAGNIRGEWAKVEEKLSAKLLNKKYKDECPIELLIYSKLSFQTTDMILYETQKALWRDGLGPFRRIWFLSEDDHVFSFHKSWWSQIGLLP